MVAFNALWLLSSLVLMPVEVVSSPAEEPKAAAVYTPKEGDFIFQSLPHGPLVDAIETATASPYSHCGIVMKKDGKWVVIEAYDGVEYTPLNEWIERGRDEKITVFRDAKLTQDQIEKMIKAAEVFVGREYDIKYEMSDEKLYCSELIYKAYKTATGRTVGKIEKLGDLNWKPIESVIRVLEWGGLPLEREMVTPASLTTSTDLTLIHSNYSGWPE